MPTRNLALKYSSKVDERFARESYITPALGNAYKTEFVGVDTLRVYSIPTVPLQDYARNGHVQHTANGLTAGLFRYGIPEDLTRNVQEMKITQDKSFTFIIDQGDKIQSMMVSDAGKALSRELNEQLIPAFDTYCFSTLAAAATAVGHYDTTAATKQNVYELFLKANEAMGNAFVPDSGRIAYCSYRFANLLKQDPAFMRYGDKSQEMLIKGTIGEVDGTRIVKVPNSYLPAGAAMLMVHPIATVAPEQLKDYRIHDNPPGVNGWLVEGRHIYDCFVLNEKAKALYYIGSQPVMKTLNVTTASSMTTGKSKIIVEPAALDGAKRYYATAADAASLPTVTYGTAITTSDFTELTANGMEITPTAGDKFVKVVEVDSASKPIAEGTNFLYVGE